MLYKIFILWISSVYFFALNSNLISFLGYKYNYEFIVKFLCIQKDKPENLCKGSCYLKNSFEKNEEHSKSSEKSNREQNTFSLSIHNENTDIETKPPSYKKNYYFSYITTDLISLVIEPILPPPKFLQFVIIK